MQERGFTISPGYITQVAVEAQYVSIKTIMISNNSRRWNIVSSCEMWVSHVARLIMNQSLHSKFTIMKEVLCCMQLKTTTHACTNIREIESVRWIWIISYALTIVCLIFTLYVPRCHKCRGQFMTCNYVKNENFTQSVDLGYQHRNKAENR